MSVPDPEDFANYLHSEYIALITTLLDEGKITSAYLSKKGISPWIIDKMDGRWCCKIATLELYKILRLRLRLPRDVVNLLSQKVWDLRWDDAWQ